MESAKRFSPFCGRQFGFAELVSILQQRMPPLCGKYGAKRRSERFVFHLCYYILE